MQPASLSREAVDGRIAIAVGDEDVAVRSGGDVGRVVERRLQLRTVTLAQHLTTPVIASGGVSSLDDLRELRPAEEHGIMGAIVGRALYDGRVTVPDAIRVLKGE